MPTALTTKLEAVNVILSAINEGPLASLPADASDLYGTQATTVLDEVSKAVQSEGWHFNTEYDVEITVDGSGQINVPTDALRIDFSDPLTEGFQKGLFMYDPDEKSTTSWTVGNTLKFTIVYYRDFTDLPEAANRYITVKAARVFASRYQGDREVFTYTATEERDARGLLTTAETKTGDYNINNVYPQVDAVTRGRSLRIK